MIPKWMLRHDLKQKFNRCLIDNSDGTFSLRTTAGSLTGTANRSATRNDTSRNFEKTITTAFAVRIA